MSATVQRTPDAIIDEIARHPTVTVTTAELRSTLMHYGADFVFSRAGQACRLAFKSAGPGLYLLWLAKRGA